MNTEQLADHIIQSAEGHARFIVAIAGPPGAGKSTLAENLLGHLQAKSVRSRIVPMDGFHLDNDTLQQQGLLSRKGSPPTFDAEGFVDLIKRLASAQEDVPIPTFDRTRDRVIADHETVPISDKVLLVEGNYLFLNDPPWAQLQNMWNETVFINPGMKELQRRLIERWLAHGLNEVFARKRALSNDIPNAEYVLAHSTSANIVITG